MRAGEYFMKQLQPCLNGQVDRIKIASQQCNNAIRIQKARQKRLGCYMKCGFTIREGTKSHEYDHFGDDKYNVTKYVEHILTVKEYWMNKKRVYRFEEEQMFCMYVEDLKADEVDGSEAVNCPNCGAPATLEAFRNGCIFCGTHFEMSEIYPVVTNYFSEFDPSMVEYREKMDNPIGVAQTYGKAYMKMAKLFTKLPTSLSLIARGALTSRRDFENIMKQYIPDFSYLHFGNTVINMIRLLLFSDDPSSLPFLVKENCPVIAPHMLDFEFNGFGIENDNVELNGNFIVVKLYMYMEGIYLVSNEKVAKVNENYTVTVSRDITKPVKMGFSYTKINCRSCGGVFDAYENRNCPFCSTPYKFQEEEWFMTDIERRR